MDIYEHEESPQQAAKRQSNGMTARAAAEFHGLTGDAGEVERLRRRLAGAVDLLREARDWIDAADVRTRPVSLLAQMDAALAGSAGGQ